MYTVLNNDAMGQDGLGQDGLGQDGSGWVGLEVILLFFRKNLIFLM